jgi:hypothetical protein
VGSPKSICLKASDPLTLSFTRKGFSMV